MGARLKENELQKINLVFSKFKEIDEVILYGSRAKGNSKPGSDIDLTIKGVNLDLHLLNLIDNKLDDLDFPYKFDVSIFQQIENKDLKDHINRVGILVYKK